MREKISFGCAVLGVAFGCYGVYASYTSDQAALKAEQERAELQIQNKNLLTEIDSLHVEINSIQDQNKGLKSISSSTNRKTDDIQYELYNQKKQNTELSKKLDAASQERDAASLERDDIQSELKNQKQQNAKLMNQLKTATKERDDIRSELDIQTLQNTELMSILEDASGEIDNVRSDNRSLRRRLEAAITMIHSASDHIQSLVHNTMTKQDMDELKDIFARIKNETTGDIMTINIYSTLQYVENIVETHTDTNNSLSINAPSDVDDKFCEDNPWLCGSGIRGWRLAIPENPQPEK